MSYDTQLLLNKIVIPAERVKAFVTAARKVYKEKSREWAYFLENLYLVNVEGEAIDLQISPAMAEHLESLYSEPPLTASELPAEDEEDEEEAYQLKWAPLDGPIQNWNDTDGFVSWLAKYCESGFLYQINEEEGGISGWAFSEGDFIELAFEFVGDWQKGK